MCWVNLFIILVSKFLVTISQKYLCCVWDYKVEFKSRGKQGKEFKKHLTNVCILVEQYLLLNHWSNYFCFRKFPRVFNFIAKQNYNIIFLALSYALTSSG